MAEPPQDQQGGDWEPQGFRRPAGYWEPPAAQGYGPPPGYGPTHGYGPPPGYGPTHGYGPPPGYGPSHGYGPPPGYGPPGYGQPPPPPRGYWTPGGGTGPGGGWTPGPLPKAGTGKTGPLPLHPMTMGDILDASFKLLRANFVTIAGIVSLLVIPFHLVAALAERNFLNGGSVFNAINNASNGFQTQTQQNSSSSIASSISSLVSILVLPFAAGAIAKVVAASYLGEDIGAWEALGMALRRWWALLLAWFLVHVMELAAGVALILPGLLVMALCVAVAPVIVLESLGPVRGIRRSWRLNRRRMWGILGICIVTGMIFSLTASVVVIPLELGAFAMGLHWGWILLFAAGVASSLVSLPLNAIVATLIYFDGRIRHEGFDLQAMSHRLNAGPAPVPR